MKSARCDRCLPPITWDRNISRIAARAESGREHADPRAPRCRRATYGVRRRQQPRRPRRCASTLPATTTGPAQPAGHERRARRQRAPRRCRRRCRRSAAPRPARSRAARAGRRRRQAAAGDVHHPAAAGQRDPAAGLGGDQLLVADHRDPQPAAGARAGQHLGVRGPRVLPRPARPGTRRTRRGRRCRSSSRWLGRGDDPALGRRSTSAALVNVEPKSTQTTGRAGSASAEGTVEVGEQVVDGLDADAEPDQVGGHLEVGAGDADAWVIRPGCSISDSTPPSDSPRVNTSARRADVERVPARRR